jgi:hypothetical protein
MTMFEGSLHCCMPIQGQVIQAKVLRIKILGKKKFKNFDLVINI